MYPLRRIDSKLISDKLLETFARFGFPAQLITDNATYFSSRIFADACSALGTQQKKTALYYPQANMTERVNRNLKTVLVAFTDRHKDWDVLLHEIAFTTRTTVKRSAGFTPAAILLRRKLRFPLEHAHANHVAVQRPSLSTYTQELCNCIEWTLREARERLDVAVIEHRRQYDKGRRRLQFSAGDKVLRRTHALTDATKGFADSLFNRWEAQCKVTKRGSSLSYRLRPLLRGCEIGPINVNDLKLYHERSGNT